MNERRTPSSNQLMEAVRGMSIAVALGAVIAGCTVDSPLVRSQCPTTSAGPYPTRYAALRETEHAARVDAFRAKNPGDWSSITLDAAGFVDGLTTKGAPLIVDTATDYASAGDRSAWMSFLKKNADGFGVSDCAVAFAHRSGATEWLVVPAAGSDAFGAITFRKRFDRSTVVVDVRGHIVRSARLPSRRISNDAASAPLVGHKYGVYVAGDNHPVGEHVDCDGGASMLASKCPFSTTVEASSSSITVEERVACVRREGALEVRRVLEVGLGQVTIGIRRASMAHETITSLDAGPKVPHTVDAVTGEDLTGAAIDDCGQADL